MEGCRFWPFRFRLREDVGRPQLSPWACSIEIKTCCWDRFPLVTKVVFPLCFCTLFRMLDDNYYLCLYNTEQAFTPVQAYGIHPVWVEGFCGWCANSILCDKGLVSHISFVPLDAPRCDAICDLGHIYLSTRI